MECESRIPTPTQFVGKRFGKLVVCERFGTSPSGKVMWVCRCDCGGSTVASTGNLRAGKVAACKCTKRIHGETRKTKEWRAWQGILTRCTNPRCASWARYGGRGIRVCDEWQKSYEAFLQNVGRAPSVIHSIDRIDPDGNYEPGNCRWATPLVQRHNRSSK